MGVLSTITWCLSPNTAYAEPPHYRIELSVPQSLPECNREPDLIGMVLPMLTGPMLDPPVARVLVVRIGKTRADYLVDVIVRDLNGQTLEEERTDFPASMSCFEVLYRAALRAAVQMNKGVRAAKPAQAQCPPPPPRPPLQCPICDKPRPSPPHQAAVDRPWFVGAGARVDMGVAPDQLVGGHFIVGWRRSRTWSIEGRVGATLPKDTRPIKTTIVRVRSVGSIEFVPCYRIEPFGLCGEFVLGNVWFTPLNLRRPRIDSALFVGAGVRGFVEQQLSARLSVRMDVEFFSPFMRAQIEDDVERDHWETSLISGSASASLFVWF
ncbi:MAG TPA: hypothetical protein PK156_39125 [Polyangium sp.]|nr:hypothetical protein [Polyangium sp.]